MECRFGQKLAAARGDGLTWNQELEAEFILDALDSWSKENPDGSKLVEAIRQVISNFTRGSPPTHTLIFPPQSGGPPTQTVKIQIETLEDGTPVDPDFREWDETSIGEDESPTLSFHDLLKTARVSFAPESPKADGWVTFGSLPEPGHAQLNFRWTCWAKSIPELEENSPSCCQPILFGQKPDWIMSSLADRDSDWWRQYVGQVPHPGEDPFKSLEIFTNLKDKRLEGHLAPKQYSKKQPDDGLYSERGSDMSAKGLRYVGDGIGRLAFSFQRKFLTLAIGKIFDRFGGGSINSSALAFHPEWWYFLSYLQQVYGFLVR